ncbi:MAG: DoxX family protein [Leifsonia xyli]|nr:MAG: DoxX family protein [Leifsonia xyli]
MFELSINAFLTWFALVMFVIGALVNGIAPAPVREEMRDWGYPDGAYYVIAAVYAVAAALVVIPSTRLAGVILGVGMMAVPIGTLFYHGKHRHTLVPLVVFALVLTLAVRLCFF